VTDVTAAGPRKTRIIAIANQKGGVGKTTTTVNLGAELAALGRRVLLVDLDPQAAASYSLGIDPESLEVTLYNVMVRGEGSITEIVYPTPVEGMDIVPSNLDLAAAELDLFRNYTRERVLKQALEPLVGRYDYILIDCPPSLTLLTVNAFVAATEVLIPLQTHLLSLRGVSRLLTTINEVAPLNPDIKVLGILPTMYDSRSNLNREILTNITQVYTGRVFRSVIRYGIAAAEAPGQGVPIRLYARNSPVARCYQELAQEIVADEKPAPAPPDGASGSRSGRKATAPETAEQNPATPATSSARGRRKATTGKASGEAKS
jgi:chromosome partitioning protein